MDSKDIEEVIKILLDDLLNRCTVRRLARSFFAQFGNFVNLQSYGCNTFTGLLRKFPETLRVYQDGAEVMVEAIYVDLKDVRGQWRNVEKSFNKHQQNRSQSLNYSKAHETSHNIDVAAGIKMLRPKEFLERPQSPAPSVISVTSSQFYNPFVPCSTPLPSDEEIEENTLVTSEINDLGPSCEISFSDILEETIREFNETPLVVKSNNPFADPKMPPLVRISSNKLFVADSEDETDDEDLEDLEVELVERSDGYKDLKECSKVAGAEISGDSLRYQELESFSTPEACEFEKTVEPTRSQKENPSDFSGSRTTQNSQESEEEISEISVKNKTRLSMKIPPLVNITTNSIHEASFDSQDEEVLEEIPETSLVFDDTPNHSNDSQESKNVSSVFQDEPVKAEDPPAAENSGSSSLSSPNDYLDKEFEDNFNNFSEPEDKPSEFMKSVIAKMVAEDDFMLNNLPPVIRSPSASVPFQEIPQDQEVCIYIAELYSPVHFWFHCDLAYEVDELEKLLEDDYGKMTTEMQISDENIKEGLMIACYLKDFKKWHRAVVVNPLNEKNQARLLFIDYGTVGMVHKKNMKYLYEKYLDYPRYGLRGRLVNLKPPNNEPAWSESQMDKFLIKFGNRELRGRVVTFNAEENVFELELFLRKTDKEVNVRDWLLEQSLATDFIIQPGAIYPICYYFPTFDALEKNFPSFHEKSVMKSKGIDYDFLIETNFLTCVDEDQMAAKIPKLLRMLGNENFSEDKKYFFPPV